jgi:glycine hydroxymethyltransferase
MPHDSKLAVQDPEIAALVRAETERQEYGLELIASENFVSEAVMEACGTPLTNKYAEGLPGKRYYGGCEIVDKVEQLAIDRAKKLFGAEHVNVQPHAGSQANMATYFALFKPGDAVISLSLAQGGHLTHGSPVNFSGRLFQIHHYGLDPKTEQIDYDAAAKLALEVKPKALLAGASAYPRTLDFARLKEIADSVGAVMICDIAHIAGLVATGLHPSPVPLADAVTTTTHKTLRGPRSGLILSKAKHAKAIDSNVFPGIQGGPLEHVIAAKAVAFGEAAQPAFRKYQEQVLVNAKQLAETLIAGGLRLVAGGTDTHLMLCDLRPKKLTGKLAEEALQRAHITTNKNMIPGDPEKPFVTSGLRLGTPALTTRGFGTAEMKKVGELILRVLDAPQDAAVAEKVRGEVKELGQQFPLYKHRLV